MCFCFIEKKRVTFSLVISKFIFGFVRFLEFGLFDDMGDCKPTFTEMETEEELVAAAKQIMKALEMKKNLMDDSKKILSNLCMQLCDITREKEQKDEGVKENDGLNEIEQQLDLIQDNVLSWERDQAIIWDCGPEEAYEYLKAVDEARKLTESLERLSLNNGSEDSYF